MKAQQAGVTVGEGREIRADEIELGAKLGEGQFARVYKATCRGQQVAVKVLSVDKCDASFIEDFRHEIEVMSRVSHPNICLYMGACTGVPGKMMIVTQLYTTSLEHVLFSNAPLSLSARVHMAQEIALGMNWLHNMTPRLVHSDLKSSNILLDENGRCVVCDFGQTQMLHGLQRELQGWGGTPIYMAPEKLKGLPHNEKVDVYAFGLILWELVHRQRAFENYARANSLPAFVGAVCDKNERPPIARDCLPSLAALIESCWHANPEARPSFQIILERLGPILAECMIPDPVGRRFWTENWGGELQVPWKTFKPIFAAFVGRRETLFWLKPLLVVQQEKRGPLVGAAAATATASVGLVVSMELFGNMLAYFGPLADIRDRTSGGLINVVDKVQVTLSSDWFHGEIDSNEAAKKLRNDGRLGAFLFRFSGRDPGTFTLSRIIGTKDNKEINHQRIRNVAPHGLQYGNTSYVSLVELVAKLSKQLGLKHPIGGSKYAKLVERWAEKTKKRPATSGFHESASEGQYGNYSDSTAETYATHSASFPRRFAV